uniref:protein SPO16 homolog n=1 Tax=Oncorhynchus gorbuscha TaxID=8017 RepID=UPI001EAE9878|nr:protein SPO16 homolog [Oncorhynchus gorbuscha]
MTTNGSDRTTQWKTTIIVSTSLQNHDTSRMLLAQHHRIRFSDAVKSGSIVFPQSGIAFLIINPQELPENLEEAGLFDKIKKFVTVHRNSFLLLQAPFYGKKELGIMSVIQHRFLGSNLRVLPVRNNTEIVKGMLTIAKATSKPHVDSVRDRMSLARAHIIESSSVWEMLKDIKLG